jgi:hypothetical protein
MMNDMELAPSFTLHFLGIELAMHLLVLTDSTASLHFKDLHMSKNVHVAKKTTHEHQNVRYL